MTILNCKHVYGKVFDMRFNNNPEWERYIITLVLEYDYQKITYKYLFVNVENYSDKVTITDEVVDNMINENRALVVETYSFIKTLDIYNKSNSEIIRKNEEAFISLRSKDYFYEFIAKARVMKALNHFNIVSNEIVPVIAFKQYVGLELNVELQTICEPIDEPTPLGIVGIYILGFIRPDIRVDNRKMTNSLNKDFGKKFKETKLLIMKYPSNLYYVRDFVYLIENTKIKKEQVGTSARIPLWVIGTIGKTWIDDFVSKYAYNIWVNPHSVKHLYKSSLGKNEIIELLNTFLKLHVSFINLNLRNH
jgi:hypothetical protein